MTCTSFKFEIVSKLSSIEVIRAIGWGRIYFVFRVINLNNKILSCNIAATRSRLLPIIFLFTVLLFSDGISRYIANWSGKFQFNGNDGPILNTSLKQVSCDLLKDLQTFWLEKWVANIFFNIWTYFCVLYLIDGLMLISKLLIGFVGWLISIPPIKNFYVVYALSISLQ